MRRDAVPPPTAPSASSSSSSLFSGGEQLFESGPSTLVFLPLLPIQGGSMDLSRVGEKLLSSVHSVRSLGLLPPTPAAPLPVLRSFTLSPSFHGLLSHIVESMRQRSLTFVSNLL
jgi:syndetin